MFTHNGNWPNSALQMCIGVFSLGFKDHSAEFCMQGYRIPVLSSVAMVTEWAPYLTDKQSNVLEYIITMVYTKL